MWAVVRGVTVACIVAELAIWLVNPVPDIRVPRSVVVLDWLILLALVAGARLLARTLIERPGPRKIVASGREAVIVGAGDAGQLIIKEMQKSTELGYTPIGLADDDPRKQNLRVHGVRVLGTTDELPTIIADSNPDEVIIAIPSAAGETRQRIVNACRDAGVPVKTLPSVYELIAGDLHLARQLRQVEVEDVLGRDPVQLDLEVVAGYLAGETVVVTGAGGSIGAELCRQIAAVGPERILLVEHAENSLVEIERELMYERGFKPVVPVLADVKNRAKIRRVFERYRPTVVFHAAAYKHVPLMEANPLESVRNNLISTQVVADVAAEFGVRDLRSRLDGQGGEPEERARADEAPLRVDRQRGRPASRDGDEVPGRALRQRPRLVGKRHPPLPPPDRPRWARDRDASGDDALLHDDPGGGPADRPGGRDRSLRRRLRARHGRAGQDRRPRAQHDPALREGAGPGHRGRFHRDSPRREAARGAVGGRRAGDSDHASRRSSAAPRRASTPSGSRTSSPS